MRHLFIAISLTATLLGCASYKPVPISADENAQLLDSRSLDDPRLQKFIVAELHDSGKADTSPVWNLSTLTFAAIYYHPDIAIARAQFAGAEAAEITARQRPNPSLSFAAAFGTGAVPGAIPAGAAAMTVGPTINFLIQTFGKREDRIVQTERLADAARWNLATAGWDVRSRVRTALLGLWGSQQRLALTHQQLDLQTQLVELLQQRLAVGGASSVDVMLARVALTQITFSIRNFQQAEATAYVRLATAIGIPVRALKGKTLSLDAFYQPPPVPDQPGTGKLRREALTKRSDVQASLQEYEAAQSALKLQIANQYPDITLSPGYNYNFGINEYVLNVGVEPLPILNQNQGQIAEALAKRQQAAARFTALQAGIIGAIDEAAIAYRAATKSVEAGDTLFAEAQHYENQISNQFDVGQADRVALVTAKLELAATALSRLDAVERQRQAIGALEDALQQPMFDPGHWPAAPPEQNDIRAKTEPLP